MIKYNIVLHFYIGAVVIHDIENSQMFKLYVY